MKGVRCCSGGWANRHAGQQTSNRQAALCSHGALVCGQQQLCPWGAHRWATRMQASRQATGRQPGIAALCLHGALVGGQQQHCPWGARRWATDMQASILVGERRKNICIRSIMILHFYYFIHYATTIILLRFPLCSFTKI